MNVHRMAAILSERSVPEPNTGCWLWLGWADKYGYGRVTVNGRTLKPHRMACVVAHGAIAPGLSVCHKCDVALCVNPDHLFLGTHAENMADMVRNGRSKAISRPGEACARSRLTEQQVLEIRALSTQGWSRRRLGKTYGVMHTTIKGIVLRRTWKHI